MMVDMDVDWFVAAVIIGIVFYVAFIVWDGIGLLDDSWYSNMFGMAFVLGALIVIVLLVKPLFFPQRDVPQQ